MDQIDKIVQVQITRMTSVPSMASFSDVLAVAEFTSANFDEDNRVKKYGSLQELVDDGFATTSYPYRAFSKILSQSPHIGTMYVGWKDDAETWTEALTAIKAENNDWYALITESRELANQKLIASWTQANEKLAILASGDSAIVDADDGDIGTYLKDSSIDRVAVFYHPKSKLADVDDVLPTDDEIPEAGWFGKMLSKKPGSATWALKSLSNISVYSLTEGQVTRCRNKNVNTYLPSAGVPVTQQGQTGSGEYIDVIHGMDWLKARIQNLVFGAMINTDKVPYEDIGVQMIVSPLRTALDEGVANGIITSEYDVTYPLVADVSATDKGNRILPDVNFDATLSGAIQATKIDGIVAL